ncbi:MAG: hypothetical protein OSB19_07875 [Opitutaceae bacterium]|jgi:hypothetical protein|nr:hypothetical protein [Opitutaceae bacterium]|tara:strand:- start:343 stop:495 length:153 start_codon:yes stop_codon:yes gene_type:complete
MHQEKEIKILSHKPWAGFKKAFIIVFAILSIYLLIILLSSPDGGAAHLHH